MKTLTYFSMIGLSFLLACAGGSKSSQAINTEKPTAPLTNSYWSLIEIQNKKFTPENEQKQVYIVFDDDGKLKGFMGCNRVMGSYTHDSQMINFEGLASSKMFCSNMSTENKLIQILNKEVNYLIRENRLLLIKEEKTVAIFEIQAPK